MKKSLFGIFSLILTMTMIITLFVGCKKSPNKDSSSSLLSSEASTPDYVYDEEKGAVVDTTTGEIVSDATYNEETKEIVKDGKVIQKNTEKVSSAEATQIVEKKKEEIKNSSNSKNNSTNKTSENSSTKSEGKNNNSKNSNNKNNNTSSSNPSNSNSNTSTKNDEYQFSGQPSSSKKVVFSKERLKNKMYSVYDNQKPQLTLRPKLSKEEYVNYFNGTCPEECKYIYDWYMDCLNNKKDGKIVISLNNMCDLTYFSETMRNKTNTGAFCTVEPNVGQGSVTVFFNIKYVLENLDREYNEYAKPIDDFNAKKKAQHDKDVAQYEKDIMNYLPETIESVINAVTNAGVKQGENETSAINKIVSYLSNRCNYYKEAENYNDGTGQWILNCLEDKRAVCNGYAKSFYAMCYYCGIDTDYYVGKTGEGKGHAWNSATVNGKKYMFDVTWYDIQKTSSIQDGKYLWVAHGDKTFNSNHIGNIATPTYW